MIVRTLVLLLFLLLWEWFGGALRWLLAAELAQVSQTIEVRLSWQDNSGGGNGDDEDGFVVQRCAGSGCGDFVDVAVTGRDIVEVVDVLVSDAGSTVYRYRVLAFNVAGRSGPSNTAEFISPAIVRVAASPSGVIATIVGVKLTGVGP